MKFITLYFEPVIVKHLKKQKNIIYINFNQMTIFYKINFFMNNEIQNEYIVIAFKTIILILLTHPISKYEKIFLKVSLVMNAKKEIKIFWTKLLEKFLKRKKYIPKKIKAF